MLSQLTWRGRVNANWIDVTAISHTPRSVILTAILLVLAGCGKSASNSSATPGAERPDFTVKFDGKRRKCIVALATEAQGSVISCDEVNSFVKDELRLAGGSRYGLGSVSGGDEAETAKVRASLDSAGYRFIGGTQDGR